MIKQTGKIAALYCRVSTDMQVEKGESIEHQKTALSEYAQENCLNGIIYEDAGFSAKDTNRPSMIKLIQDIKDNKVESVLVVKLDRITRSIKDLLDLLELFEAHNVSFKSLTQPFDTSSAMGRGFLRLMGEFAQIEREMISDRVTESMKHRAKKGKWNGGVVTFGYVTFERLVIDFMKKGLSRTKAEAEAIKITPEHKKPYVYARESKVVKKIFKKYLEYESIRAVTQWLNKEKIPTKYATTWATTSVSRVLQNATYIGKLCYGKRISSKNGLKMKVRPKEKWIIVEGEHEPIIDEITFKRVQTVLKRQRKEPRRKLNDYLLTGLLKCGKCKGSMQGYSQQRVQNGKQKVWSYYKCSTHQSKGDVICSGKTIQKDLIEKLVTDRIINFIDSDEFNIDFKQKLEEFNSDYENHEEPLKEKVKKFEKKLAVLERKQRNLLECLEDNTIARQVYKTRAKELSDEYEEIKAALIIAQAKLNDVTIKSLNINTVYENLKHFKEAWPHYDFCGKKELLWSIVEKVIVKEDTIEVEMFFLSDYMSSKVCTHTDMGSCLR